MKDDLDRFGEKLTPEEERRVWSAMRGAIRGPARGEGRMPVGWLRFAAAAGVAVLAVVLWRAGDRSGELGRSPQPVSSSQLALHDSARVATERPSRVLFEEAEPEGAPSEDALAKGRLEAPPAASARPSEARSVVVPPKEEKEEAEPLFPRSEGAPAALTPEPAADEPATPERGATAQSAPGRASAPDDAPAVRDGDERADASMKAPEAPMAPTAPTAQTEGLSGASEQTTDRSEATGQAFAPRRSTPAGASSPAAPESLLDLTIRTLPARGPGEIRGRVTDAATGNPVAHAQVVVIGTPRGAMTGADGSFVIRNLPDGTYDLKVMMMGYEERTIPGVVVAENVVVDMAFTIEKSTPKELGVGEVIVKSGPRTLRDRSRLRALPDLEDKSKIRIDREDAAARPQGDAVPFKAPPAKSTQSEIRNLYPSDTGGDTPVNDELADDVFFRHYGVNPFIDAEEDALSTFGLDVDTGSYTVTRKYLQDGALPPPEAVRLEEFVNFFRKNYPPPERGDFRIQVDGMPSPFAHVEGSYHLIRVGIRGRVVEEEARPPVQLILVIDSSGSMSREDRIELLKASVDILLDELRSDDEIGVVAFNTEAWVVLEPTPVSRGEDVRRAIHALHPDGSTNAEGGLRLGYRMARDHMKEGWDQRIILCSDGVANRGRTGWESILKEVRDASDRTPLTTVGFGMGNYNDILLEQLADAGDGQYAYVDNLSEAIRIFRDNVSGTLHLIARNTKVQVEFDRRHVDKYRLLGYENRNIRDEDFRNDAVDAGEIGSGHEVSALYEVKLKEGVREGDIATVYLRYETPEGGEFREIEEVIRVEDLYASLESAPGSLILDAAVGELAEILRESYWAKGSTPGDVQVLLGRLPESMRSDPDVVELRELVKRASDLSK